MSVIENRAPVDINLYLDQFVDGVLTCSGCSVQQQTNKTKSGGEVEPLVAGSGRQVDQRLLGWTGSSPVTEPPRWSGQTGSTDEKIASLMTPSLQITKRSR